MKQEELNFSEWLRLTMRRKRLTQKKLAERLFMNITVVGHWVRGYRIPKFDQVQLILKELGYHIEIVQDEQNSALCERQ